MQSKRDRSGHGRAKAAAAIGIAAVSAGAVTLPTAASAATKGISGPLKIITWVNPPAVTALTKIDSEFEQKYPNVKVQLETAANDQAGYATLLSTSVDSGTADIVTDVNSIQPLPLHATRATMTSTELWAASGAYLSLNNQPWIHAFTNGALQLESYNGKVYGILSGQYQRVIFYNKADFAKYHLSVPTTYNQFLKLLATLKADHVTPLWLGAGGGAPFYTTDFITQPLMSSVWEPNVPGHNLTTDLQTGSAKWTDPGFLQVLKEEVAIGKYLEPGYAGVSWEGMPGAFASNKAPMLLDGSWDLATVHTDNPKLQVGSFPMPGSNIAANNQPILQPDLNFEILKKANNIPAALAWLKFFASKPIYEQYVDITGISPSETGGTYTSFAAAVLGKWLGKGVALSTIMPAPTPNLGFYDSTTEWGILQESVISGSKTPAQAAQLTQSSWKK
jgi:raffinose/stachyose/melibiose transport system substrate-binding protein